MKKFPILFSAILICLSATLSAQQYIYDQSYEDEKFLKFKAQLLTALVNKDTSLLFPLFADEVKMDLENKQASKERVKEYFRNSMSRGFDPFEQLLEPMEFGFRKYEAAAQNQWNVREGMTVYQAPSYLKYLKGNGDDYLLVLGENVNIREKPTIYSKVLKRATFERLKFNHPANSESKNTGIENDGYTWYEVYLAENTKGYIVKKFTSLNVEREISVRRIKGDWKIISIYAMPGC